MGAFKVVKRSIASASAKLTRAVKARLLRAVACGAPPSDGEPGSTTRLASDVVRAVYVAGRFGGDHAQGRVPCSRSDISPVLLAAASSIVMSTSAAALSIASDYDDASSCGERPPDPTIQILPACRSPLVHAPSCMRQSALSLPLPMWTFLDCPCMHISRTCIHTAARWTPPARKVSSHISASTPPVKHAFDRALATTSSPFPCPHRHCPLVPPLPFFSYQYHHHSSP